MTIPQKTAVVLLSGGLDSATVLAIAAAQGFQIAALSFDYGQRHAREIQCAAALASHYHVLRHDTLKIDLRAFGGSALTANIPVPKDQLPQSSVPQSKISQIPITYVPARNTIFLSFALGLAEVTSSFDIFLGVNAIDYSGYPDCRPEFIAAFEKLANLATKAGVEAATSLHIHAPLIQMTKSQIIREGLKLGVPYHLTHSCYDPTPAGLSCGHCDSCLLRLAGFHDAGIKDPLTYA
ncbi:MAG TPA: 7-cyano-7-deazaguanine synthase QueC [Phycisphaerae bacterium]|jgi:7-cyano-7-deazaguanine synthase